AGVPQAPVATNLAATLPIPPPTPGVAVAAGAAGAAGAPLNVPAPTPPSVRSQVAELCGSLLKAAVLSGGPALARTVGLQFRDGHSIAKAFFLTLACTWAMLIPARFWTAAVDDSWVRRAILLMLGLAIGLEAIWLDGYKMSAVWADEVRPEVFNGASKIRPWNAWRETHVPLAVSYLGYFGLAFFATRWWKLTVRTRTRRFSLPAVF